MYSTSSSECECDEYCTYGAGVYGNQGSYGKTPFYPTMGHPLVYYAQMPPPSKRQRSREIRKKNKNCFAKAFRWYTQEHVPYRSISPNKTDINAFAVWLDSKYDEFLRDSQLDSVYHVKMKHTSIIEADRIPNNTCCEPRKRFRVKSPWRKKLPTNNQEAGDVVQKPNQSFQFILQPKEFTRPASEYCQPSDSTMMSTEIPMRSTIKTQSYTLISHDPPDTGCGRKSESNTDKPNADATDERKSENKALHNTSCQCSEVKVQKINAQSQYDYAGVETVTASDNQITARKTCQPCHNSMVSIEIPKPAILKEVQPKVPTDHSAMFCQCHRELIPKVDSHIQYETHHVERGPSLSNIQSSSKIVKTCPCENVEEFTVENLTRIPSPTVFSNDCVQTSDHSLCLEKDAAHGYPLFMKIVCADKLSK